MDFFFFLLICCFLGTTADLLRTAMEGFGSSSLTWIRLDETRQHKQRLNCSYFSLGQSFVERRYGFFLLLKLQLFQVATVRHGSCYRLDEFFFRTRSSEASGRKGRFAPANFATENDTTEQPSECVHSFKVNFGDGLEKMNGVWWCQLLKIDRHATNPWSAGFVWFPITREVEILTELHNCACF